MPVKRHQRSTQFSYTLLASDDYEMSDQEAAQYPPSEDSKDVKEALQRRTNKFIDMGILLILQQRLEQTLR